MNFPNVDLNDFKSEITSKPIQTSAEFNKEKKTGRTENTTQVIQESISIKADQILDFDLLELDPWVILAVPAKNYLHFYSFSKETEKMALERRRQFLSADKIEEWLYTVCFCTLPDDQVLVATGGLFGFIYLMNLEDPKEAVSELVSNNGDVYALSSLSTHQKSPLLLAGYKNGYTLLWDLSQKSQIATFRNFNQNPPSDVASLDWHSSGKLFLAGHLDTRVILWQIGDEILEKGKEGKRVDKSVPLQETFDGHSNYVDCVRFWGNLVISKDVEGIILIWTPFRETLFVVNVYSFPFCESIWYIRFSLSPSGKIALGNDNGELFIYQAHEGQFAENYGNGSAKGDYFGVSGEKHVSKLKLLNEQRVIRKAIFSKDERFLFCISDGGRLWWKCLRREK